MPEPFDATGKQLLTIFTFHPDLAAQASVRFADPKAAGEFETRAKPTLAETSIAMDPGDTGVVRQPLPEAAFAS